MKELAYGASHEINNPLANISARAQTLLRDERDPERRRALESIQQQALRAHEMISDLMLFARPPQLELAPVDAGVLVRQIAAEMQAECQRRDIAMSATADADLPVLRADAVQLAVAVRALAANAVEAIGRGGNVEITANSLPGALPDADGDSPWLRVEVRDDGPGIAAEIRPHVFDPFFSGREAGRGLGFGLSKAWRIVHEHGGRLTAENAERGAIFRIELPAEAVAR